MATSVAVVAIIALVGLALWRLWREFHRESDYDKMVAQYLRKNVEDDSELSLDVPVVDQTASSLFEFEPMVPLTDDDADLPSIDHEPVGSYSSHRSR